MVDMDNYESDTQSIGTAYLNGDWEPSSSSAPSRSVCSLQTENETAGVMGLMMLATWKEGEEGGKEKQTCEQEPGYPEICGTTLVEREGKKKSADNSGDTYYNEGHRVSHIKFKGCCASDITENQTLKKSGYVCTICNDVFKSGQALGGHKSSSKTCGRFSSDTTENQSQKKDYHVCTICSLVFDSRERLGGHKSSHTKASNKAKK